MNTREEAFATGGIIEGNDGYEALTIKELSEIELKSKRKHIRRLFEDANKIIKEKLK
jgi:hypothetical protein